LGDTNTNSSLYMKFVAVVAVPYALNFGVIPSSKVVADKPYYQLLKKIDDDDDNKIKLSRACLNFLYIFLFVFIKQICLFKPDSSDGFLFHCLSR